jgi:hypothetical protein
VTDRLDPAWLARADIKAVSAALKAARELNGACTMLSVVPVLGLSEAMVRVNAANVKLRDAMIEVTREPQQTLGIDKQGGTT